MTGTVLQGKLALVTGASSGLGADLARELAGRGCHLVLVARREERLRSLCQEIRDRHGVSSDYVVADLSIPETPQQVFDQVTTQGRAVDILVNNAGFGVYGLCWEIPWAQERQMLAVDVVALTHLTKLFLPGMLERDTGYILQVSSYGAYAPSPTYASYSAAKRYVLDYGEAMSYELRKTNVWVTVLAPGIVATEFHQVSGQEVNLYQRLTMTKSPDVARKAIDGMLKGKRVIIPDRLTLASVRALALLPRRWQAAIAHRLMTL